MSASPLSVVFHGHFYQPPRDHPWWETVETQASAKPYHDWNERVTAECYRAVVAARIPGPQGRIADIVNALERISFNFGPTLLEWMEVAARGTYRNILEADATSRRNLHGHGNALAQAYHHAILPLAARREKVTEVRWGIADFKRRFRRDPAGMWLPETAVDLETLDVLAQEGIAFTILAPHQVNRIPLGGMPGLVRTSGGRSMAVFLYDGPLSHGVAFGSLLKDAPMWAQDVLATRSGETDAPALVSLATDGETYGHHHPFGEMALAAVLGHLENKPLVRVENFASFLSRHPAVEEVTLTEPSSWSCPHGVERWRSDCGCRVDPNQETQQSWRVALRDATDWLAGEIHNIYEEEATPLLGDPWEARNRYGELVASAPGSVSGTRRVEAFPGVADPATSEAAPLAGTRTAWVRALAPAPLSESEVVRALELLELERQALRLFTSCAWFFDDLARIEPLQVLAYAARALELTGRHREHLEEGLLQRLDQAISNEDPPRTGRDLFVEEVIPCLPAHLGVAGGAALWEAVASTDGGSGEFPLPGPGGPSPRWRPSPPPSEGPPVVPGFGVVRSGSDTYRITHTRTGRCWEVETRVHGPSPARIAVETRMSGTQEAFEPVGLQDIPGAYRARVLSAVTRSILGGGTSRLNREGPPSAGDLTSKGKKGPSEAFVASEASDPAAGLGSLLSSALLEAVHHLPHAGMLGPPPPDPGQAEGVSGDLEKSVARVRDLAELHSLLGLPIPFDAQTDFWRILKEAPGGVTGALSTLREPLGFTLPL